MAFYRSRRPRDGSYSTLLCVAAAIAVTCMFPPLRLVGEGPLNKPTPIFRAAERLARAFLFVCTYTIHVYGASPISNTAKESVVSSLHCLSASAWIYGIYVPVLSLVPIQWFVVLYCSFGTITGYQYASTNGACGSGDDNACIHTSSSGDESYGQNFRFDTLSLDEHLSEREARTVEVADRGFAPFPKEKRIRKSRPVPRGLTFTVPRSLQSAIEGNNSSQGHLVERTGDVIQLLA